VLQNQEDERGATFNFGEEYVYRKRDVKQDADIAMDMTDPIPKCAARFTKVALKCVRDRSERRPTGEKNFEELQSVLEKCSSYYNAGAKSAESMICDTCRTMPAVPACNVCSLCLFRSEMRDAFTSLVSSSQAPITAAMKNLGMQVESFSKAMDPVRLDGLSKQIETVSQKIDATIPVLAHVDRRLNNPVPRMFILIPADMKRGWKHPRSWLRSKVQTKFYLFFVCAVSQHAVSPPIKLAVPKEWVCKIAPVLAAGLYLLQMSVKAGLNVNLSLDGATDLLYISLSHIAEMFHEVSVILDETGRSGLLDRLRSQQLTDQDVQELTGDAYELVIEQASEQKGWRSQMEPVQRPPSPKVFWVTKAVASDPQYEVIKA
jgi:hypothetical protein